MYIGYKNHILVESEQEEGKNFIQIICDAFIYGYKLLFQQEQGPGNKNIVRLYHPNGKTIYQKIFNHKDLFKTNQNPHYNDENKEEEEEKEEDNKSKSGTKSKEFDFEYEHVLPDSLEPYGARMIKKKQKPLFINQNTDTNIDFKKDETETNITYEKEEEENVELLQKLVKNAIELYNNKK